MRDVKMRDVGRSVRFRVSCGRESCEVSMRGIKRERCEM